MPYTGADSTLHVYGLQFGYDLDGRRKWLRHPDAVAPVVNSIVKDTAYYTYQANGQLAAVTDVLGNRFSWAYDAAGRPDTLYYPGFIWEHWHYDADSRIIHRLEYDSLYCCTADSGFGSNFFRGDTIAYDARGKIVLAAGEPTGDTLYNGYTALGNLARSSRQGTNFGDDAHEEGFHPDALGNNERTWTAIVGPAAPLYSDSAYNVWVETYSRVAGRLDSMVCRAANGNCTISPYGRYPKEMYMKDSSGHRFLGTKIGQNLTAGGHPNGGVLVASQFFYDAGGQLRMADKQGCDLYVDSQSSYGCYAPQQIAYADEGSFEEYRYDPLGRRVLVRSRADTTCLLQQRCQSTIQRTVWDGDQVLYEIRYPGGDTIPSSALERDTMTVFGPDANYGSTAPYGRIAYTHGAAIDQPLGAIRIGYSAVWPGPVATMLHADWRGTIDRASFDNGASTRCKKKTDGTDSTTLCVNPDPAASLLGAYFADPTEDLDANNNLHQPTVWFGNLITQQRDASGLFYRDLSHSTTPAELGSRRRA